jgi:hypothetical protein
MTLRNEILLSQTSGLFQRRLPETEEQLLMAHPPLGGWLCNLDCAQGKNGGSSDGHQSPTHLSSLGFTMYMPKWFPSVSSKCCISPWSPSAWISSVRFPPAASTFYQKERDWISQLSLSSLQALFEGHQYFGGHGGDDRLTFMYCSRSSTIRYSIAFPLGTLVIRVSPSTFEIAPPGDLFLSGGEKKAMRSGG